MKQTRKERILRRALRKFRKLARVSDANHLPYAFRLRFGWVVTADAYAETVRLWIWDRQGRIVAEAVARRHDHE